MQTKYGVHLGIAQNSVAYHEPGASDILLGRLEYKLHISMKLLPMAGQNLRRTHQRGGVTVVAAGMHHPIRQGAVRHIVLLLKPQGVHIRPQRNRFPRLPTPQEAHRTGQFSGVIPSHLHPQSFQMSGH